MLSGEPVQLPDAKGPTLVHFWATWCSICRLEKGSIDSIATDHRVVAIASQSGTRHEVAEHVEKNGITVPVLVDESGELARKFGVKAFPTSFVVDAQGNIVDIEVGYTTEWGLRWRLWRASW
jgi:thiol-disulfide isomerase/thioredoxin